MPRRIAKTTQADIARALRAVNQLGLTMAVEVSPDGTIRIVPAEAVRVSMSEPSGKPQRTRIPL